MPKATGRAVGLGKGPGGEEGHSMEGQEEAAVEPGPEGQEEFEDKASSHGRWATIGRGEPCGEGLGQSSEGHRERHRDDVQLGCWGALPARPCLGHIGESKELGISWTGF